MVVQRVARLPFPAEDGGASPTSRLHFTPVGLDEANALLRTDHYLGAIGRSRFVFGGWADDCLVAVQVWATPTARLVPQEWLELTRWCLAPESGRNAGSRMMGWVARWMRKNHPEVRTGVSYSDPGIGHDGALYKASGWVTAPTHHTLRRRVDGIGYPSGHGSWGPGPGQRQEPKERWTFSFRNQEGI